MSVSENDLELLETYLDGELNAREVDALIDRLRQEPVLAAAMEALKGQRELRLCVWQSCEADDELVGSLMDRVEHRIDSHWAWSRRLVKLRMVSGAAACLFVGVMVGWLGRGQNTPVGNSVATAPPPATRVQNVVADAVKPSPRLAPIPVDLPIVDQYGRVVAYEHVEPDRAEELQKLQERAEPAPASNVVPVAQDRF
jgi:hypothetical protein